MFCIYTLVRSECDVLAVEIKQTHQRVKDFWTEVNGHIFWLISICIVNNPIKVKFNSVIVKTISCYY